MSTFNNYLDLSKYTNNRVITWDQFFEEVQEIHPINVPIYDVTIMQMIGNYSCFLKSHYLWEDVDGINIRLFDMLNDSFPYLNIELCHIDNLIDAQKKEQAYPKHLTSKLFKFLDDKYKNEYVNNKTMLKEDTDKYLTFRITCQNKIDQVIKEYLDVFEHHESMAGKAGEILINNFSHLENDENFIGALEIFDKIEHKAGDQIEKSLLEHVEMVNKKYSELLPAINYIQDMENKMKIKNETMEEFGNQIDNIYLNIIKSYGFDDNLTNIVFEHFIINKQMHLLSFTLEHFNNTLEGVINNESA